MIGISNDHFASLHTISSFSFMLYFPLSLGNIRHFRLGAYNYIHISLHQP